MRVVILGGTRFAGRALVAELSGAGHAVAVVHRGIHEVPDDGAHHIHAERRRLREHRAELARFRPDAVIDMAAMTAADAEAALAAFDDSVALVVASSLDVYRAATSLAEGRATDAVPLAEDAPLRDGPPADRGVVPPGWDFDLERYEKLDVERLYGERGGMVCRLPMVYGEHDYKRREEFVLRRVLAGRTRIPVGSGALLWSRGYAPELARGMRLAAERGAAGDVFNLAERDCATIRLWIEEILAAAGHEAELVRVADELLPEDLGLTEDVAQHWSVDSAKAARLLDWVHAPRGECIQRSVDWHLANPPDSGDEDFSADDRALATT